MSTPTETGWRCWGRTRRWGGPVGEPPPGRRPSCPRRVAAPPTLVGNPRRTPGPTRRGPRLGVGETAAERSTGATAPATAQRRRTRCSAIGTSATKLARRPVDAGVRPDAGAAARAVWGLPPALPRAEPG